MVQVGATVSYHDPMDEQPEQSWTASIRSAVHEFVEAVSESSKQLASASERFAVESLQAVESARARSEASAAASQEMARQAQQAAEEARNASAGLQSAVDEAREMVRNEARTSVEQVASQTARISEIGAQVKYDLQQRIEEMVARLEGGTAVHQEAMETAHAATTAAQAAADRIESSVNAVEAAVTAARSAAEEARKAAEQSAEKAGNVSMAVASAQEAAESSRQAASLAEQAGKRSDFAAEAGMLLERLETDYSLLTRLVQELHSRISSLSSISVAPPAPEPVYEPEPVDAPEYTDADAPLAYEAATQAYETPADAYETPAEPYETPVEAYEAPAVEASWQEPVIEAAEPPAEDVSALVTEEPVAAAWPVQPPVDLGATVEEPEPAVIEPEATSQPAWETPEPVMAEPVAPELVAPAMAVAPSIAIFGRVQMTISPVPDFDRLLSLDSALARIDNVHSVTLADYAREEVIFRVELEKAVSVVEFARQLSDTAGVPTEVTEASESTLSIRIG